MFGKYPALNTRIISVDYVIFVTCIGDIELGKSRFVYVIDDYMKSNKCLYVCVCMCVCVCVVAVGGSAYLKIVGVLRSTYLYRFDLEKTRCDDIRRFE